MATYTDYQNGAFTRKPAATLSTGPGDADRIPATGADGRLDESLLSYQALYGYEVTGALAPTSTVDADIPNQPALGMVKWLVTLLDTAAGVYSAFEVMAVANGSDAPFVVYGRVGAQTDVEVNVVVDSTTQRAKLVLTNPSLTAAYTYSVIRLGARI